MKSNFNMETKVSGFTSVYVYSDLNAPSTSPNFLFYGFTYLYYYVFFTFGFDF